MNSEAVFSPLPKAEEGASGRGVGLWMEGGASGWGALLDGGALLDDSKPSESRGALASDPLLASSEAASFPGEEPHAEPAQTSAAPASLYFHVGTATYQTSHFTPPSLSFLL